MRPQRRLFWYQNRATAIQSVQVKIIPIRGVSSHQHRLGKASTPPAVSSASDRTRTQGPGIGQKNPTDGRNLEELKDPFQLFRTFADSQKNYECYGGRNLFRYTYKQATQRFNALSAEFSGIDRSLLISYVAQHPDSELFRKFKEITDLRQNYIRTVGSKTLGERTDESAAQLRAEGLFSGLPRLLYNARSETGKLKEARRQYPYTTRSSQLMREETKREMQNASYLQRFLVLLSPDAQVKEQLRVLIRWIRLSELDELSPRPLLTPSLREELKDALAETHELDLKYVRLFQLCKAVCILLVSALIAWKAGSGLVDRLHTAEAKGREALEEIPNGDEPSSS